MYARVSDVLLLKRIWKNNGMSLQILGYKKTIDLNLGRPLSESSHLLALINQAAVIWAALWRSHEAWNWEQLQPEASEHPKLSVQESTGSWVLSKII